MKKISALILTSFLTVMSMRADVIWQELFNYTNGNITATGTNFVGGVMVTNWIRHSGSGNDAYVNTHRLEVSATGGTVTRQDDVHRNFLGGAYTNNPIPVYASFIINCTNLPNAIGTYFAHFYTTNGGFQGKIFAAVGTNLCLPNTYRLGVSGVANSINKIFPIDLAMNQDYQVVMEWDPASSYSATLWVNPVNSTDISVVSSDSVSGVQIAGGFATRQASSFGNWFCTISNLVTATTFDEASTNVWGPVSLSPTISYDLRAITNYVGVPAQISVVAAGQSLASFVYLWQKDGAPYANPNGNTNVLAFASPALSDSGNYSVTVSNTLNNLTVSSATALMWVTNGPPVIAIQPTNQAVYPGKTVTVSVVANGTPTLKYSWLFNGGAPTGANVDPSTTNTATLVINNVQAANGTLGKYNCLISNDYGSTNSFTNTLTLLTPQIVNIDTLRGMVDSTFFLPTNTSLFYTVTNAVVYTREVTNADGTVNGGPFTAAPNAEFYIQDGTGGIAVFVNGGAATVQPRIGDIVTVTGPIGNFNSLLQFNMTTADTSQSVTITGHTNTLPAPVVLPLNFPTNSAAYGSVSNVIRKYEGRYVTLTNVFFPANLVGGNFASGNTIMTNLNGDSFILFLNAANVNIIGKPVPQYAQSVSGPMGYFLSTTDTNRSKGFEIDPSSYSDIVAGPPAPKGALAVTGGGVPGIKWSALPAVSYSILWATNVEGPYVAITNGLYFANTNGTYTDVVNTNLPASFYKISSP